jgi:hypothetical protein
MRLKSFRIIATIVLLAVISMFTGLETASSAAPVEKATKSCCDGCGHNEDQERPVSQPGPQSAPDCPAFMCLSFDIVNPIALQLISPETTPFFSFMPDPIPAPFIKSIFHPPSLV